jgi:hypothetical protein
MSYSSTPITKGRITFLPQARSCMDKLGITKDEVVTTMIEWERDEVVATDPVTANILAAYSETADEIPAFYEAERDLPERNLILAVYFTTSIQPQRGKPPRRSVTVHWVSSQALPEDREPPHSIAFSGRPRDFSE